MAIDNPTGLVKFIVDDVNNLELHVFQPAPPRIMYVDKDEKPLKEEEYDEILEFYTCKDPVVWNTVENSDSFRRSQIKVEEN